MLLQCIGLYDFSSVYSIRELSNSAVLSQGGFPLVHTTIVSLWLLVVPATYLPSPLIPPPLSPKGGKTRTKPLQLFPFLSLTHITPTVTTLKFQKTKQEIKSYHVLLFAVVPRILSVYLTCLLFVQSTFQSKLSLSTDE